MYIMRHWSQTFKDVIDAFTHYETEYSYHTTREVFGNGDKPELFCFTVSMEKKLARTNNQQPKSTVDAVDIDVWLNCDEIDELYKDPRTFIDGVINAQRSFV